MEPFQFLKAVAVPLDESNVDTDQICPARFIRKFAQSGSHGDVLLHDRRFAENGTPISQFVLNQPVYAGAQVILAQRNFGVGSSREAAVSALLAAGFRAVIAESFGDIFVGNCFKNGFLVIQLAADEVAALRASLEEQLGAQVAIDLAEQKVWGPDGRSYWFAIGALRKRCLMSGMDDLALTEGYTDAIKSFERMYNAEFPWIAA